MSSTLASSPPVSPTASEPPLEFFQTAWTLQLNEDFSQIGDWSLTELALKQIEWQLRIHKEQILLRETEYGAFRKAQNARNVGAASLLSMCTQDIIDLLEASDNLFDDVAVVAESLNASAITEIVRDPRTPYLALRIFHGLPPNFGPANAAETARSAVDLDEAILVNERYLRARGPDRNLDRRALLNLDDIDVLLGLPPVEEGSSARVLVRKDPPAGGFEFLDTQRPRQIQIQPSTAAFVETFHRITGGILKGLNWENVFVAGGMVLTTLLHLDPSKDSLKKVRDCDVDIYIYGLNSVQANQKVEEIYNVWTSNLPAGAEKLVVKNAKTINFLSKYPTRRLQIVLKLAPHPTSILLNFDLDPCAMGFDGKQVTMLPRCVRALETGYSTFTMDLIWGHHLEDRRATQEQRVFKYASRGFGIRILPCYVSCLEQNIDSLAALYRSTGPNEQARKPDGPEPGLKTMKRIALLGRDMVHRFYYGISELARCPEWEDVNEWNNRFRQAMRTAKDKVKKNVKRIQEGLDPIVPLIKISDLDSRGIHPHFPGGRKGVGGFEQWMRHCEAWRLDQIREAK
ncbi:MAG: hypothetical protein M1829_004939 [Trizodia sp. TS-e1964]|nr:MAG: hypothetical protein M1829_004939 [Trizodia sp. TS-e1964]